MIAAVDTLTLVRMVEDHDPPMGVAYLGLSGDGAGNGKINEHVHASSHHVLLMSHFCR